MLMGDEMNLKIFIHLVMKELAWSDGLLPQPVCIGNPRMGNKSTMSWTKSSSEECVSALFMESPITWYTRFSIAYWTDFLRRSLSNSASSISPVSSSKHRLIWHGSVCSFVQEFELYEHFRYWRLHRWYL